MKHFGKAVVSSRFVILIAAVLLLIPSIIGIRGTRINYDMLVYLPDTIETMQGQDILVNEFGTGAISMLIVEGKEDKEIVRLKEQVEAVDHVKDVIWYDSFADISIPKELLPQKLLDVFVRGDATLLAVTYDTSTSADETMEAVTAIRELLDDHSFLQGTNAVVSDTKILCEEEEPVYVGLAVLLALIITGLAMDTFAAPVLFLLSIGCAILYNMGTNVFLGEISYVTKAVAAVLQLGVTMDYSIFLWHSFEENMEHTADSKEAMASAIQATFQSVVGSSDPSVHDPGVPAAGPEDPAQAAGPEARISSGMGGEALPGGPRALCPYLDPGSDRLLPDGRLLRSGQIPAHVPSFRGGAREAAGYL